MTRLTPSTVAAWTLYLATAAIWVLLAAHWLTHSTPAENPPSTVGVEPQRTQAAQAASRGPAKSGPNKGRHTEASLDRATHEHRCPIVQGPHKAQVASSAPTHGGEAE